MAAFDNPQNRWLFFIHQLPAKPAYLRVKVGRRLARIGAVALKNSVYVLPRSDATQEDFQWVLREVEADGGEATLLDARLLDGVSDGEVEGLFRSARDADYLEVAEEARALERRLVKNDSVDDVTQPFEQELGRLERRLEEIVAIDFFEASGRDSVQGLLIALRSRLAPKVTNAIASANALRERFQRRIWVTRSGVHVDRIASAWLIQRFIDPEATFKFVPAKGYVPEPDELRFDMFEAEFTHEGDACTFEVLLARFELMVPGMAALGELVHDIDIKDGKFGRPETAGLAAQVAGLALVHSSDQERIAKGSELFEQLLAHFAGKERAP